jgi:hypothetical protein
VRGVHSRSQKYKSRSPLKPAPCSNFFSTKNRTTNSLDETGLPHLASLPTQHNPISVTLQYRLRGRRPPAFAIAPNGQYVAFHYDTLRSNDVHAMMSVIRWPSRPTLHHKPQLQRPILFTEEKVCFGYERCMESPERYNAVVRLLLDWILMGKHSSRLARLQQIRKLKYPWDTEWHISGDLLIHLSHRETNFEVWDTLLRGSQSMTGSSGGGMAKDLLTSPAENIVIALKTDSKVYVWLDLKWSKVQGSIAHELQIFSLQDRAYLERATLNGIYLVTIYQRRQFFDILEVYIL